MHKSLDEFEFLPDKTMTLAYKLFEIQPDPTTDNRVSCP